SAAVDRVMIVDENGLGQLPAGIRTDTAYGLGLYNNHGGVGSGIKLHTGSFDYERMRIDQNGLIGIGTNSPAALLDIFSTGHTNSAMIVPRDTAANRPSGVNGMIRYNSTTQKFEVYQGLWQNMIVDASAAADNLGN